MDAAYENPHRTYIRSNTATVMYLLWFLTALLSLLVVGLSAFVVLAREDNAKYHWDEQGQFYYELVDHKTSTQAVIVNYADNDAENYQIPEAVTCGGKSYQITAIGAGAFANHQNLKTVELSQYITEIGERAFAGCAALENVNLPSGITNIDNYAFQNCLALSKVELPDSLQFVGTKAFQNCLGLQSIVLNTDGNLGLNCFENCFNVKTLSLADHVHLTERSRNVLADLSQLSRFEITGQESSYQTTPNYDCLLTKTEVDGDTIVLGGRGAEVPAGVTRILDYAWGKRSRGQIIYVPSNVTIGANSFGDGTSLITDSATNPFGEVKVSVYYAAQKVDFIADAETKTQAYVYYDQNHYLVRPGFATLFPTYAPETPFEDWIYDTNHLENGFTAKYQTAVDVDTLETTLSMAQTYLADEALRLKFNLEFWENFKSVYDRASDVVAHTPYDVYTGTALNTELSLILTELTSDTPAEANLESADWQVALPKLVAAVTALDTDDFVQNDTWTAMEIKVGTAQWLIESKSNDSETAMEVWQDLRRLYESLTLDRTKLDAEIAKCENLSVADYAVDSWDNLQVQLTAAKQICAHNLSITHTRQDLIEARANLSAATVAENKTRLDTWLSLYSALPEDDYQKDGYDRLQIAVKQIRAQYNDLKQNQAINEKIADLQGYGQSLKKVGGDSKYHTASAGLINQKTLPYFIVAVMLFTGAVACGAKASLLHKQLRQTRE